MRIILFLCIFFSGFTQAQIKVASFNVRNYHLTPSQSPWDIPTNNKELVKILKKMNADIIGLQEIVETDNFRKLVENHLKEYNVVFSECGGFANQSLAFLYKKKLTKINLISDKRFSLSENCNGLRPAFIGTFQNIKGKKFTLINLHLKAGATRRSESLRHKQYLLLEDLVKKYKNKTIVILGDFNSTDIATTNVEYLNLNSFLKRNPYYRVQGKLNCTAYWSGGRHDGTFFPSTLDHILVKQNTFDINQVPILNHVGHCKKLSCKAATEQELGLIYKTVSDHCPIYTKIN